MWISVPGSCEHIAPGTVQVQRQRYARACAGCAGELKITANVQHSLFHVLQSIVACVAVSA
jgi:hypothetical protein